MKLLSTILLLAAFSGALTRHVNWNPRLSPNQPWNTKRFPVWKEGDPRYKNSWTGGKLRFDVGNDAPTLTGAKITFSIDIVFPHTQKVLPDGRVVWAKNCSMNGTQFHEGEPVYPEENSAWNAASPNLSRQGDKPPPYCNAVLRKCLLIYDICKYWQVCDGPSSSVTIDTDDVPLGSYVMDVVIYHYRQKDKFIPIGYASTQFCITVNDKDEADHKFIQNRAVAFSITLHDPSQYLSKSDVTFNWNFGDGSGTVISRELTVTHTYIASGGFKPQVVIQAAIPDPSCEAPSNPPTEGPMTSESPRGPAEEKSLPSPTNALPMIAILEKPESTVVEILKPASKSTGNVDAAMEDASISKTKRHAPNMNNCVIYRYGSFSTDIDVIEGIESVQIMEVAVAEGFLLSAMEQNAVDFTVSCQGSLPTEVCTIVSDADCRVPVATFCNAVSPSPDCHLILRHFFNDSGTFCINVSMANDVSRAVTNARVNINIAGSGLTSAGAAAILLGILTIVSALGTVAFAYKRLKGYHKLTEEPAGCQSKDGGVVSMPALFWSMMNQQMVVEQKKGVV
ncbi:hypothetical protein DNTS_014085 [Danionella cerebrum]|uniref:PKD domain-containing protein n=1 Tax=Danionella cerebrum TaxID=2873325 RepID=A0A553QF19_9TELE|nr:hypothetical protein DNTS_014085 [Danionella translucida]